MVANNKEYPFQTLKALLRTYDISPSKHEHLVEKANSKTSFVYLKEPTVIGSLPFPPLPRDIFIPLTPSNKPNISWGVNSMQQRKKGHSRLLFHGESISYNSEKSYEVIDIKPCPSTNSSPKPNLILILYQKKERRPLHVRAPLSKERMRRGLGYRLNAKLCTAYVRASEDSRSHRATHISPSQGMFPINPKNALLIIPLSLLPKEKKGIYKV